nr:MAG TPA: Protein of unknown function (DUF2877) [Caudoviricetes sp.]
MFSSPFFFATHQGTNFPGSDDLIVGLVATFFIF